MINQKPIRRSYAEIRKERADLLKVDLKGRMASLVTRPEFTIAVANANEALYELLNAWQREITSPMNAEQIGPTLLAMKSIQEFLETVAVFGFQDQQRVKTQPDTTDDNT